MGEPDPDDPFDELGLHFRDLVSQIGHVSLCCDIRQVDIDSLLDGCREGFGLGVRKAGGGLMPGVDLTDPSTLQEADDLDYVRRMQRFE